MARPLVPATTAFVGAIRQDFFNAVSRGQVWVSSVALCELYAGTRSREEARLLDRLSRGAERAHRLLVPTADEWVYAGQLLARRTRLQGAVHPRDHLADLLIVVSAARIAGQILTANRRHFEVWTELARQSGFDVTVATPIPPLAT